MCLCSAIEINASIDGDKIARVTQDIRQRTATTASTRTGNSDGLVHQPVMRSVSLIKGDINDYNRDEDPSHVLRSTVSCRRPRPIDRVLPEARLHLRRPVGWLLRHRLSGRTGTTPEGSAEEPGRASIPARQ